MRSRKLTVFVLLMTVSTALACAQAARTATDLVEYATRVIDTVDVRQARTEMRSPGVFVIDVREKEEFDAGHLPNAINVPRGLLEFVIGTITTDQNARIFLYCKKGGRGALSTQSLRTMGYKNAANLQGGYEAWVAAELPISFE